MQLTTFFQQLNFSFKPTTILDILLVAIIIYYGYSLIRQTRAMAILWGILFLAAITLIARWLQLQTFNYLVRYFITMILVAIPVVFQPELRQALERLGRMRVVGSHGLLTENYLAQTVSKIVAAVEILSKKKWGALIVINRSAGLKEYIETGIRLNARLSTELLLNIFTPNAPLHDRAAIISGDEVVAAAATLPLAEDWLDTQLGTRHRAGLGLAEVSDAIVIIVSEETGRVSVAVDGQLRRSLDFDALENILLDLLNIRQ